MTKLDISSEGLKFIAAFETSSGEPNLKAVKSPETNKDGSTKYEIGWGHNSDSYFAVDKDTVITYEQAIDILHHDAQEAVTQLNKWCSNYDLFFTQQEFDALCSALYNGIPVTSNKTGISRALIEYGKGDTELITKIEAEWGRWIYFTVNGKKEVANGLVKRRKDEVRLFKEGIYKRT